MRKICLVIIPFILSCASQKKTNPRPLIKESEPIEEFSAYGYSIKAYENRNYGPEDWIYRFECIKENGTKREFSLRTKIIQSRQFYLSEKLSGGWESIVYFDARPTYTIVKAKLIEVLSRKKTEPDSLKNR